jgi:hypothetical protein
MKKLHITPIQGKHPIDERALEELYKKIEAIKPKN